MPDSAMLPRYAVPALLAAVAVLVVAMYAYPNTGVIQDIPDFTERASTVPAEPPSQAPGTGDAGKGDGPKHYVINASDSPVIGD